jgi:outer membrane lipoprotein SlyB
MKGDRMYKPLCLAASAAFAFGACAADQPSYGERYASIAYYQDVVAAADEYGRVVAIDAVRGPRHSSGAGAVLGGVVGGVLGHQVGSGRGKDAATVAGAVGGAVVGNEVEKRHSEEERVRITVRFRDGREGAFEQESARGLRVGDRVRVAGDRIVRD